MIALLGGHRRDGVCLTIDEMAAVRRLYGFTPEDNAFMQSGADKNMFRHAEADGLRVIAWLARHLSPGDDPVAVVVRLAGDAGWDTGADAEWAAEQEE